jgi:hypothetical protein
MIFTRIHPRPKEDIAFCVKSGKKLRKRKNSIYLYKSETGSLISKE